jgi:DNA-binding MarR family transcriptional regulator
MTAPPQKRPPFSRRITPSVVCVLLLLLADPDREWYGSELADRARCHVSTAGRILWDLKAAGWVVDREQSGGQREGMRIYHRLTEFGVAEATKALHRANSSGAGLGHLTTLLGLSLDAINLDRPEG